MTDEPLTFTFGGVAMEPPSRFGIFWEHVRMRSFVLMPDPHTASNRFWRSSPQQTSPEARARLDAAMREAFARCRVGGQ